MSTDCDQTLEELKERAMNNIIDFMKAKEARNPHTTGKAICILCGYEWVAVRPVTVTTDDLWFECPECHSMKGHYIYPFEPHEGKIWTCNCGNVYFLMSEKGTMCANCGSYQSF